MRKRAKNERRAKKRIKKDEVYGFIAGSAIKGGNVEDVIVSEQDAKGDNVGAGLAVFPGCVRLTDVIQNEEEIIIRATRLIRIKKRRLGL